MKAKLNVEEEPEEAHQPILDLPAEKVAKQWFRAVAEGNEAKVVELLAADPAVTDMLSCVENGPIDSSSMIADDTVSTGCTALLLAAGQGHDKIVELLLAAKSSVDATDFDGRTALHYAAKRTSDAPSDIYIHPGPVLRVVKLLLAACPTLLDVVDEEGCTALLCAVKQKNEAIVNQLLLAAANDNPKSLDAQDSCGMNVLHYAIQQENEALVWRLLQLKPELIHRASANGFTPLHMAIHWADSTSPLYDMQSKLFRLCPQVATDYDKEYLLRVAVRDGCEADLDLYLPHSTFDQVVTVFRAMPDKKSPEGRLRPLIDAQCGLLLMMLNQDLMGIVYEYLFIQRQRNERGQETKVRSQQKTRWFEAARRGDKELVTQMLSEDPSLIEVGHRFYCNTALHAAAKMGHRSIVELLLAASPTLSLLGNNQGITALMSAAERGHHRVVEMLIDACPESLDLADRSHCTALLHASSNGKTTVRTILAANPRNLEATDIWGYTVLHHAIRDADCMERVEKLLELDPNLVCNLNRRLETPLRFAVEKGANKLIKILFDKFPRALRMAAEDGMTPYGVAAKNRNDFAVDFFMPKLTFEENVREFRKFYPIFEGCGKRLRFVVDVQCEDAAKVLNPTLMSTIYSYLGFGTLVVFQTTKGRNDKDEVEAVMSAEQDTQSNLGQPSQVCKIHLGGGQPATSSLSSSMGQGHTWAAKCFEHGKQVQDQDAVEAVRLLAEQGNAAAQCHLGVCYANGTGVERDEVEAVRLYRLSAEQGNACAQYNLGLHYEDGRGLQRDEDEAVRLYRLAAEQGYALAQFNLAVCYADGAGVERDEVEAVRLYGLSAAQGLADAQCNLAVCYANGTGVQADEDEAVRLYRLSAEQANAIAQYNLAVRYADGKGVQRDDVEAVRLYRLAAEQGDADAQCNLGVCYENGTGVQRDEDEAVRLYRLAAEQGNAAAQCNLGVCYDDGTGVHRDEVEAIRLYRLSAAQGYAAAQFNLAVCYADGTGVLRDEAEAVRLYRLSAEQGNACAQYNLAVCYDNGTGVLRDEVEAVRMYRLSAEQGLADAQYNLAVCYADEVEAARLYGLSAAQGNERAQRFLPRRTIFEHALSTISRWTNWRI